MQNRGMMLIRAHLTFTAASLEKSRSLELPILGESIGRVSPRGSTNLSKVRHFHLRTLCIFKQSSPHHTPACSCPCSQRSWRAASPHAAPAAGRAPWQEPRRLHCCPEPRRHATTPDWSLPARMC